MNAMNSPNWIQWLSLVLVVLIGIGGVMMYSAVGNVSDKADATASKVDNIKVPTSAEIAANIVIPQAPAAPAVDTTEIVKVGGSVSKLCSLTNDCATCFDFNYDNSLLVRNELSANSNRLLKKSIKGITGLDTDEYAYISVIVKDSYTTARTCVEGDDGNYQTEVFYRITYREIDSNWDDNSVIYVSVTGSVEDNMDVTVINTSQVDRDYEISKPSIL